MSSNKIDEIIILGSGTCVPSVRRAGPAICLRASGKCILIDTASGTLRQLAQAGIDYSDIDSILYTHLHPDHVGEFVPFVFAQKYAPGYVRNEPVKIIAATGFNGFYDALKGAFGKWVQPDGLFKIYELPVTSGETDILRPIKLSYTRVMHTPNSLAYRLDLISEKSVVFTGDTDFCSDIIDLAYGADILVSECAAPEKQKVAGHLIPSEVGKMAEAAGVKRLILTHFYPVCDQSDLITPLRKYYDGPVLLANDFMRVVV